MLSACGGKIAGASGDVAAQDRVSSDGRTEQQSEGIDALQAERECQSPEATSVPQEDRDLDTVCTLECQSRVRCSGAHIGVCLKTCLEESQRGRCVPCTAAFWRCQSRNKQPTDETCGNIEPVVEPECERAYRAMVACRQPL
jgi:hypothetical protein